MSPQPDAVAPDKSPAEHLQAEVLLLLRVNSVLTQLPTGSQTWGEVKDLQTRARESVAFWTKLTEDRAEEPPRMKAIRCAIKRSSSRRGVASGYRDSVAFNARVKALVKVGRANGRPRTCQRGPVLAASRSRRSPGLRTRGSRRCSAAASGESDSAGGGEPPPTSSRSRSHVGPPGTRKALAGGFHSFASLARASVCFYGGQG